VCTAAAAGPDSSIGIEAAELIAAVPTAATAPIADIPTNEPA
jgi:hypothetical protein